MGTLWQDIKYGFRMLARSPRFTVFVVVLLAIGVGTTTAMLSVVDAVMLRSRAPYKDPETLVCVYETDSYVHPVTGVAGRYMMNYTSLTSFRDWRQRSHVFTSLVGAHQSDDTVVPHAGKKEKTRALYVSPEFFSTLGTAPILGRTFAPEEERPGGEQVAILSYTHWQHWFGGDPNVIGRTLTVNDQVCTVIGVLPAGFSWVFQRIACGLWMPMTLYPDQSTDRNYRGLLAIGRLQPGVGLSQAQAEMDVIAAQLAREYPDTMRDRGINVVPLNERVRAMTLHLGQPRILAIMLSIVASVLLIASLHVASLLISRSAVRQREIAVRAALGARRLRLVRQLLTESLFLAGLGGLAGTVLTYWILGSLSALRGQAIPWYLGPGSNRVIPWFLDVRMDARSLLYIMAVSLVTCVAFGLLPALSVSRARLSEALSAGHAGSRLPRFHRLRAGLVALDIAIAFVLLTGAGLMVNSFTRLLTTDLQVNARNVLVAGIDLYDAGDRYARPQQRIAYSRRIMEGVRRLPGVQSVAVANGTPAWAGVNGGPFTLEGLPPGEDQVKARLTPVSTDYLRLFQIPLLKGRPFTEHDHEGSTPVAIVSESLARCFGPTSEPIGKHVHLTDSRSNPVMWEIVGVVRDVKHLGDYPDAEVYVPDLQDGGLICPSVIVRTEGRPADLAAALRREILAVDPEVPVSNVFSLQELVMDSFSKEQSNTMLLLVGFAGIAVLLAGIGVYGTVAYTVSQRTHEIGIRMALGARSRDVLRAVLRQGLALTVIGLALGLGGALAATRIIRSRLYGVTPTDPLTFVCVALLLGGVALLACYLPARRAARIDPMVALRYE
jgi:putative ABC transport system permease protein